MALSEIRTAENLLKLSPKEFKQTADIALPRICCHLRNMQTELGYIGAALFPCALSYRAACRQYHA